MKKQVFGSKKLQRLKKAWVGVFIFPILIIILGIVKNDWIEMISLELSTLNSGIEKFFFFIEATLCILMESIIPIVIYLIVLKVLYKRTRKNETFASAADIEYYREKLPALSPTDISLLCDLKVENLYPDRGQYTKIAENDAIRKGYIAMNLSPLEKRRSFNYIIVKRS